MRRISDIQGLRQASRNRTKLRPPLTAGVCRLERDRIQKHALHDVSSKKYDRWKYMRKKRAGMARWDKFVRALLANRRMSVPTSEAA